MANVRGGGASAPRLSGWMVFVGFVVLSVLAYDFWWFGQSAPLVFGWIPFWVFYQILIQVLFILLLAAWVYQRGPEDDAES
ncbi:MAG: hypothetical protein HY661_18220 [Betaproteobacteria bacterium]|nr:hypothetical protein [Betaproteobacteria bacterium]